MVCKEMVPVMYGFKTKARGLIVRDGGESHGSRATDGDVTGSGFPEGDGHDVLPCWGQHKGVEWGPYLGYGEGSGV